MAKVLISVSDGLLEQIDREADERGMSRSRFLREAAQRQLGWPDQGVLAQAVARGRAALAEAGAFESGVLVAEQRRALSRRDRRR